jgi:hypothetical protein
MSQPAHNPGGFSHSVVKFHQGAALLRLADTYPTLLDVILEQVQNALDINVRADRVWIEINYRTRQCIVRDNGRGASEKTFNSALQSICEPDAKLRIAGTEGENPLGQFSIGLISPLGKCAWYTFTSCPAPLPQAFREWKFVSKDLADQRGDLYIPMRSRSELTLSTPMRHQARVEWRTEVHMYDLTRDVTISRVEMNGLVTAIVDRFAITMRKNKTIIHVRITDEAGKIDERNNVQAPKFAGKKLPEVVIENDAGGKTWFRMHLSQKTKKVPKGKIVMGTCRDDFRFPVSTFLLGQHALSAQVVEALRSGVFEGEIVSQKAELNPDRGSFKRNDGVRLGLGMAIEEWYELHGSKHLEAAKEERRDSRYQDLGVRCLGVIEELLRDRDNHFLMEVINSFKRGTVGPGHTEPDKIVGTQDTPAISVDGGAGGTHTPSDEPSDRVRHKPKQDKEKHTPGTVAGPKGPHRNVVSNDSLGLQLAYDYDNVLGPALWSLDTTLGVLTFNVTHPHFVAVDVKDSTLM